MKTADPFVIHLSAYPLQPLVPVHDSKMQGEIIAMAYPPLVIKTGGNVTNEPENWDEYWFANYE